MNSFQASKSPYDLALDIIDNPDGDCLLMFVFRSDLYQKRDVEKISKSYEILVKSLSSKPDISIDQVDMYTAEDIAGANSLVRVATGPSQALLWPHNLVRRVDYIAQDNPSKPSVRAGAGEFITYSTLVSQSIGIANALCSVGLGVGSTVAVFLEQSPTWVASILGILRIGATYVPLDPGLPLKRLATIIIDCQPQVIVVDEETTDHVLELCTDSEKVLNLATLPVIEQKAPVTATNAENAMTLYTILKYEGLQNWFEQASSISSAFNMSITQVFLALCYGGSVYLLPRRLRGDAEAITNLIAAEKITLTSATPSEYFSWLRYGSKTICAGEPVDDALLGLFDGLGKIDLRFYNSGLRSIYVLGDNLKPVPIGVQGEIFIGALTSEKFVGWTTMHRTGDLGRWRQDGAILIEGRISGDTQIKLRVIKASNGLVSETVVSVRLVPDITKLHNIDPRTDFFHVGGTSLLLLGLQARIRTFFGLQLRLVELFESSTLGEMAQRIMKGGIAAERFDWEAETQLSPATLSYSPPQPFFQAGAPKTVILTGATGFLGQALVRALSEVSSIEKIHCICVRDKTKGEQLLSLPKVVVHYGDLTFTRFGLSDDNAEAIFGEADLIIHNGADVSHLKTFRSLRQANLQATKQMIEMSLPRRIPMHYISTGGVCTYSGLKEFPEISVSTYPPMPDAFDGYTASKWAGECYLEKVNSHCDWPIWIYRPSSILRDDIPELDLMQNLIKYSRVIKAVPRLPKLRGFLDLLSRDSVVQSLVENIGGGYSGRVRFVHVESSVQAPRCNGPLMRYRQLHGLSELRRRACITY
ncbi:hypothetical protein F4782DRAFT_542299 [Xylaria castorea]|nr:hypothetical protein F4782DRAFT_542299 [Xylaria castorea]